MRELPSILRSAVDGLSDTQLDTPYREGGWTVRQVVHHLADSHANAFLRFKWVMAEDHPTIRTYDQDAWAALPDYQLPIADSLLFLQGLHSLWASFLESLPESAWARTAFHPEQGDLDADVLLDTYSGHGAHHVRQISDLKARKGW